MGITQFKGDWGTDCKYVKILGLGGNLGTVFDFVTLAK